MFSNSAAWTQTSPSGTVAGTVKYFTAVPASSAVLLPRK